MPDSHPSISGTKVMSVTLSLPLCKQGHLGFERSHDSPKVTQMETRMHGQVWGTPKLLPFLLDDAASRVSLKKAPLDFVLSLCTEPRIPSTQAHHVLSSFSHDQRALDLLGMWPALEPRMWVELAPDARTVFLVSPMASGAPGTLENLAAT